MTGEILDVITEDDQVLRQEMRSTVHQLGLLHRGVHVLLTSPDGHLILQRRAKSCELYPLALDCLSEHVISGESFLQAAHRGLLEELGLRAVQLQPLVKFHLLYGPNDPEISLLYHGVAHPDDIQYDPSEVDGIHLLSPDQLDSSIKDGSGVFTPWFIHMVDWIRSKPSRLQVLEKFQQNSLLIPGWGSGG